MNTVRLRIETFSKGFLALEEAMDRLRKAVLLGSVADQKSAFQHFLTVQRTFTKQCEGDEILSGAFSESKVESGAYRVVEEP